VLRRHRTDNLIETDILHELNPPRTPPPLASHSTFADTLSLNDQRPLDIQRLRATQMHRFPPNVLIQEIEAKAILFAIILLQQPGTKQNPILLPHHAFKNGFLNANPIVLTLARNSAQSSLPLGRLRVYVISNQNQHVEIALFQRTRNIFGNVPADDASQNSSLSVCEFAHGH